MCDIVPCFCESGEKKEFILNTCESLTWRIMGFELETKLVRASFDEDVLALIGQECSHINDNNKEQITRFDCVFICEVFYFSNTIISSHQLSFSSWLI